MELSESILREQLRDVLSGEIVGFEIQQSRNDADRFGKPFLARERFIMGYTSRMKGFARQGKTQLVEFCRALIATLQTVRDDEPLYFWVAIQPHRRVSGLSTPSRVVGVIPDDYLGASPSNENDV
jgi:hypothetical protein